MKDFLLTHTLYMGFYLFPVTKYCGFVGILPQAIFQSPDNECNRSENHSSKIFFPAAAQFRALRPPGTTTACAVPREAAIRTNCVSLCRAAILRLTLHKCSARCSRGGRSCHFRPPPAHICGLMLPRQCHTHTKALFRTRARDGRALFQGETVRVYPAFLPPTVFREAGYYPAKSAAAPDTACAFHLQSKRRRLQLPRNRPSPQV